MPFGVRLFSGECPVAHQHTCTLCRRKYDCWCGEGLPAMYRDCAVCSELKIGEGDIFHAHAMGVAIE